jgi:hypothetical protein
MLNAHNDKTDYYGPLSLIHHYSLTVVELIINNLLVTSEENVIKLIDTSTPLTLKYVATNTRKTRKTRITRRTLRLDLTPLQEQMHKTIQSVHECSCFGDELPTLGTLKYMGVQAETHQT